MIKILGNMVEKLKDLSYCFRNGMWGTWLDSVTVEVKM